MLACQECGGRNYRTKRNRHAAGGRLELMKFCPRCREHRPHVESK